VSGIKINKLGFKVKGHLGLNVEDAVTLWKTWSGKTDCRKRTWKIHEEMKPSRREEENCHNKIKAVKGNTLSFRKKHKFR
jgi:hypothetical protein